MKKMRLNKRYLESFSLFSNLYCVSCSDESNSRHRAKYSVYTAVTTPISNSSSSRRQCCRRRSRHGRYQTLNTNLYFCIASLFYTVGIISYRDKLHISHSISRLETTDYSHEHPSAGLSATQATSRPKKASLIKISPPEVLPEP